jgi:hypothetical protein
MWKRYVLYPDEESLVSEIRRLIEENKKEGRPRMGYSGTGVSSPEGSCVGWMIAGEYPCPEVEPTAA